MNLIIAAHNLNAGRNPTTLGSIQVMTALHPQAAGKVAILHRHRYPMTTQTER